MATEFEIIKRLRNVFPKIGDDAAEFRIFNTPIISTDSFVVGEHFGSYFTPYDIGYKSIAASISDIAACGGVPKYVLISVGLKNGDIKFVEEFCRGVKTVTEAYGVDVLGGDTTKSRTIFVSVTVIGETKQLISRSGAKLGDIICVTGELGGSAAGLLALQNGIKSPLVKKHLNPVPRIKEGGLLKDYASSMIDISDGLMIDLSHILEESGVGARIWRSKLPIDKETLRIVRKFSLSPQDFAMNGGEDFELLFTIPRDRVNEAKKNVEFTEIGEVIEDRRQKAEGRRQKIEDRKQKTEDRRQRTEVRGRRSEVRSQRSEVRSRKSEVRIIGEEGEDIPIKGFDHFERLEQKEQRF